jgi:hypothetical protein
MSATRQTFTDHAQTAPHAAKSAKFVLRTDTVELQAHNTDGDLHTLRAAPSLEKLRDEVQKIKGTGISNLVADEIISAINNALLARDGSDTLEKGDRVSWGVYTATVLDPAYVSPTGDTGVRVNLDDTPADPLVPRDELSRL